MAAETPQTDHKLGFLPAIAKGDLEGTLAACAVVIDRTFTTPVHFPAALEPHATTAWWEDGKLTLRTSNQVIGSGRTTVAKVLGIDHFTIKAKATACSPCSSKPLDIMLVLDRTGSMCQFSNGTNDPACTDLTNAKNGLLEFVNYMDPAIHKIGLAEVARIRAEMEQLKANAGFQGDLSAFMTYLRTDPQFYAKTPYELLAKSAYVAKRMDAKLPETIEALMASVDVLQGAVEPLGRLAGRMPGQKKG